MQQTDLRLSYRQQANNLLVSMSPQTNQDDCSRSTTSTGGCRTFAKQSDIPPLLSHTCVYQAPGCCAVGSIRDDVDGQAS
jgi:hypothetical protein